MRFDVMMLIAAFGASTFSTLASTLILFAMIGEINRQRDSASQVGYFHFSWVQVLREYRLLYPDGKYIRALHISIFFAGVFSLIFLYLLFGVLPKYAVPSRPR